MSMTLISDCDGVLIDSEVVAFDVLMRETQKIFPNVDVAAYLDNTFGQKMEHLVQHLAQKAGAAIPDGFLQHLRTVTDADIERLSQPVADVDVLVNSPLLKAVVSNSAMPRILSALNKVGLSQRADVQIFSAEQVQNPKPAPDLYRLAAQTLGVMPQTCVVIEDSESGVQSALAAGMTVIGFVGGLHIPAGHADKLRALGVCAVLERLRDLPALLEQQNAIH